MNLFKKALYKLLGVGVGDFKPELLGEHFRPLGTARAEAIDGRTLAHWTDSEGFIGNRWPISDEFPEGVDYGDAMQRTGFVAMGELMAPDAKDTPEKWTLLKSKWERQVLKHKVSKGFYVRRPGTKFWHSKLNTTTGDQLRPLLITMGLLGMKQELKDVAWALVKRAGFYWNTRDTGVTRQNTPKLPGWSGPEHFNIILRGLLEKGLLSYILLLPGDFVGLLSTIFATLKREPARADQLNRIATLVQGAAILPTFLSKFSLWFFRNFRPTWRIYVDQHWNRMWRRDDKYNPGLFVLESYFWNRDVEPPIEFGPWRYLCKRYFWRTQ